MSKLKNVYIFIILTFFFEFQAHADAIIHPTYISIGNSYAEDHIDALVEYTGCDVVDFAEPGQLIACSPTFCNRVPTLFDTLDVVLAIIESLPTPVILVFQAGHGDEMLTQVGLSPEEVATNAMTVLDALLATRMDLEIFLLTGDFTPELPNGFGGPASSCDFTYDLFLPYRERLTVVELSPLEDSSYFRDSCHPNYLGTELRIQEFLSLVDVPVCAPEPSTTVSMLAGLTTLYFIRRLKL